MPQNFQVDYNLSHNENPVKKFIARYSIRYLIFTADEVLLTVSKKRREEESLNVCIGKYT